MEALAAVSLAGNVCQFIDFASKVLKEGRQISVSGASLSVQHLSIVTGDLEKLLSSLNQHIESCRTASGNADGHGPLNSEDQALLDIAKGCEEVVTAMLSGLKRYPQAAADEKRQEDEEKSKTTRNDKHVKGDGKKTGVKGEQAKRGTLRSLQAALSLVWGSKHLSEMQERLNNYRDEISLRLLVSLNASQRAHLRSLDRLESSTQAIATQFERSHQDIVEVLSVQCNTMRLKLDQGQQQYTDLAGTSQEKAEKRHAETIAAILTHRDGRSTTVASPAASNDTNTLRDAVQTGQNFSSRTYYGIEDDSSFVSGHYTDTTAINLKRFTKQVLEALEFREMDERRARVAEAYDHTFEWLYDDSHNSNP